MATEVPGQSHSEPLDLVRLFRELRERHIFKVAAGYLVAAWLLVEVSATVGPAFGMPDWVLRAIILTAFVGFLATMGVLLFRPRQETRSSLPIYLPRRARIATGAIILVVAAAAAMLSIRSIAQPEEVKLAVLPFSDLSPQRDKAFLAEGVAEEILSALGQNPDIRVLGRTSAWALRDRADDPEALRASLGLTHLLEGSVRAVGPQLRLSVRLIRTSDGAQEWAENYDGRSEDVFALQDRVADAVADRLTSSTSRSAGSPAAQITTADAYNLYLAARQIARTRTEPELKRAHELASRVVEAQPNFAPGHALLAELTWMLSDAPDSYGTVPAAKARAVAIRHARKAITLAPEAAEGHAALGLVQSGPAAVASLQRAMKLDPARSEIPLWTGLKFAEMNRFADALSHVERAAMIDPLWPAAVSRYAIDLTGAGHAKRASEVIAAFEARGGDPAQVARFRATQASLSGDLSEVLRWGHRALQLNPDVPYVPRYMQRAYALLGVSPPEGLNDKGQEIRDRFYRGGMDAAGGAEPLSAELWDRSDFEFLVYAAAAKRDWPRLAALYDLKSAAGQKLCTELQFMAATFVLALRTAGRTAEAKKLLRCVAAELPRIQNAGPRHPGALAEAELAALSGDQAVAFARLENAVAFGWTGKTARLTDLPAFDSLMSDRRYAALQGKLDAWIARERAESRALVTTTSAS